MLKRRTKKSAKPYKSIVDSQIQTQLPQFIDLKIQAMEQQIGANRAERDWKIEHLLMELRLLRSYFTSEELQKPVLQVFEEIMPNLSLVVDERNKNIEVKWREKEGCNGMDVRGPLLQSFIPFISRFPGFDYFASGGRMSFIGADNLQFKDIVMEELSDTHTLAIQEDLQTPGVTSQRLSIGMTPKTRRLPKPGEVLVSVHGSPLGVFKENNMEAINESEEG